MGQVVLGMTMSLDGFVNDRSGSVSSLYPDLAALRQTELLQEAMQTTGAVVMGWNAFAMAQDPDWYAGNYEFQVPIFVITHEVPRKLPKETDRLKFTFVTDGLTSAVELAKRAAGDKNVMVIGGAQTAQQLIKAGLVDELQVGIVPLLLGQGLRLFEHIGTEEIPVERIKVIDSPTRTDLVFRVVK